MKLLPKTWLRIKPKPKPLIMEIKPMSAEILKPPVARAIAAWKKLQEAHAAAAATIMDQDKKIADDAVTIAELKATLEAEWPEDMGGSTGGVVG